MAKSIKDNDLKLRKNMGNRLKGAIANRGDLTYQKLASHHNDMFGTKATRQTIQNFVEGHRRPPISFLYIFRLNGLNVNWIIDGENVQKDEGLSYEHKYTVKLHDLGLKHIVDTLIVFAEQNKALSENNEELETLKLENQALKAKHVSTEVLEEENRVLKEENEKLKASIAKMKEAFSSF